MVVFMSLLPPVRGATKAERSDSAVSRPGLLVAFGFLGFVHSYSSVASFGDNNSPTGLESYQARIASTHKRVEADVKAVTVSLDEECHSVPLCLI